MALNLDARQRAMLDAMGITVWLPDPAAPPPQPASMAPAVLEPEPFSAGQPVAEPVSPVSPVSPQSLPQPSVQSVPRQVQPAPAPVVPQEPGPGPAPGWLLGPALPVYPQAGSPDAGRPGRWLLLLEPPLNPLPAAPAQKPAPGSAETGLQGEAAQLLDNMLRALGLQDNGQVFSAALCKAQPAAEPGLADDADLPAQLRLRLAQVQPDCVLVLGLASARAVLGRQDALGRLRAQVHAIGGVPVVVTYDPNYLLRAPQAKAGAWADLCRAQALVTARCIPPNSAAQ